MITQFTRRALCLSAAALALAPRGASAAWPLVTVHKDPNCGCCSGWVAHLETNGFNTRVVETAAINRVKARLGVPFDLWSCHTAELGAYLVEGHVPAAAIKKFLQGQDKEKSKARGLAVPGMPNGSPGMTGDYEEYDVILFGKDGNRVYGRYKGETEI